MSAIPKVGIVPNGSHYFNELPQTRNQLETGGL